MCEEFEEFEDFERSDEFEAVAKVYRRHFASELISRLSAEETEIVLPFENDVDATVRQITAELAENSVRIVYPATAKAPA